MTVALDYSSFVMKEEGGEGAQFGLFTPQPTRGCKLEILVGKRFHMFASHFQSFKVQIRAD